MKYSAYIATSADGYIAKHIGGVDWYAGVTIFLSCSLNVIMEFKKC
jgi:hypothetical protein